MAKSVSRKKINYGDMAAEAIVTDGQEPTPTPTHTQEYKSTDTREQESTPPSTPTPTRTPKYAPAHLPTIGKGERKTERLQLLVRPSTKSHLAEYARAHGTSSNEVVQRLLDDLLDDAGY